LLKNPESYVFRWRGDEQIEVSILRDKGLLCSPVTVRVEEHKLSFDGFYVAFNGLEGGYSVSETKIRRRETCLYVYHTLRHESLPMPIKLAFKLWMVPYDKALRVQVSYPEDRLHLDRLGIGPHRGNGLEPQRIFLGRMLVMNGPFKPFHLKHNYNLTRYWCFVMANGITEMQASDRVPRGFACDPSTGHYDLYTYCDSPITYTFLFTSKGPQEAIEEYRRTLDIPAPPTVCQLPGRVVVMAAYPIRERYEDFLDELAGRGVRDFVWLSYYPSPDDREYLRPYGALYAVYDMYTDLFDQGPRKAKGWSPKLVLYDHPGHMMRGYWGATRLLPNLYVKMAKTRVQGTLGRELENRGFLRTSATKYSNLTVMKRELRPTALYLDVHSSKTPVHYYDCKGKHYPARDYLRYERRLFDFARRYLGNVPILSEGNGEAFAGIMDGGIFMDWPTPQTLGISCGDWEYYPFIDQVHRGRLLSVGFHWPLVACDPDQISLGMLFGRLHAINAYAGVPQTDVGRRAQVYYVTSAFHRMLGVSRMERVDFLDDDIHRVVVGFSNGARVWVNRSKTDWEVEGHVLPPDGYLVVGPNGFRQFRCRVSVLIVEAVHSQDCDYYCSEAGTYDFGAVVVHGAIALRRLSRDKLVVYELQKPRGEVLIRLGCIAGTRESHKVREAWVLLTRNRRVRLSFPDIRQASNVVRFRPAEMATTVGYEIALVSS